ncbi:transmembrane protein [Nitrospirillum viridazoti Y2]|uniref:Uncharacterized protein n=1 Tax=Nitrospirillum amazonense TaxID=28077 RepID=A0A560HKP9_9PROT|nr:hypothetical protein [Nitrospirillum amazonense]EGY01091.1 transmembrane protein [Nitrospirillum amazonense Y2]TWB47088.1 hypothetical protein FBZ92_13838 [Nitrospirillum amazonense]
MRYPSSQENDSYVYWPILTALGLAIIAVLIVTLLVELSLLCLFSLMGLMFTAALTAAIVSVEAANAMWRRRWRRALSLMLLPLAVIPTLVWHQELARPLFLTGEILHFHALRPIYLGRIKAMPNIGAPKLALFIWGDWLATSYGVVYDESDEVALPSERRSDAWTSRADQTLLTCGYSLDMDFGGHFYFVSLSC